MIVINAPKLRMDDQNAIISAVIDYGDSSVELWYKFPGIYYDDLDEKNADAFLVGILFLGLKTGEDIFVKSAISSRLYYSITHYLIPSLLLANKNFHKIRIEAETKTEINRNTGNIAATGMSCGIDSFATYIDHLNESNSLKIKFFTYFNVGSHVGFGGEKGREVFNQRLSRISSFSKKVDMDLIAIDSNLSEILKMNFRQTHTLRSISCVLHLQKLIRTYYYASAYRFDHFELNQIDTSDSDILNLHLLSTESTQLFSSVSQYTRAERTKLVSENSGTYKHLDVCTSPQESGDFINCSKCIKCLRTQFTLELINKLDNYKEVFNLNIYENNKNNFLAHLLYSDSLIDKEIVQLMRDKGSNFTLKSYYYLYQKKYMLKKKQLKRIIGRI
jgi:hypothetical protein